MEINSAEFVISNTEVGKCPQSTAMEYAFIGRSNVGKSSLINMLTNNSKLAKTSSLPGKTLLINHFLINKRWYMVDLPGYGFAQRGKKEQEKLRKMIYGYILERSQMANLFLLVDARHEPRKNDIEFMSWLGENSVPFSLVFTKSDKMSAKALKENINVYLAQLGQQWEELPPYFVTSAEKRMGRDEILSYIDKINKEAGQVSE